MIFTYDFAGAKEKALQAMDLLPANNLYWRMNVAIYLGDAALFSGDPRSAYSYYLEAHKRTQKTGNRLLTMTSSFKIATSLYYQGKIHGAEKIVRTAIDDAKRNGLSNVPRIGLLWTLLGEILREKGLLDDAERSVERGLLFSEPEKPCLGWNYIFKVALAFSKKDHGQALETVHEAEMLHQEVQLPLFIASAIERWKARLLAEQGEVDEAVRILSASGINKDSPVKGGYEWRHLALARILLKQNKPDLETAGRIIGETEKLSRAGGYHKLLLEALILKILLLALSGARGKAGSLLLTTLAKGKKQGYFQAFCDNGSDIETTLRRTYESFESLAEHENAGLKEYMQKILQTCGVKGSIAPAGGLTDSLDLSGGTCSELIEELTARELEVLSLIKEGLSNEAIAKKLYLSLGTVKWHTTNIYGKLGVRRRTEAVALAGKLRLID